MKIVLRDYDLFSDVIYDFRREHSLSLQKFATICNVSFDTILDLENNQLEFLKLSELLNIVNVLNISFDKILFRAIFINFLSLKVKKDIDKN